MLVRRYFIRIANVEIAPNGVRDRCRLDVFSLFSNRSAAWTCHCSKHRDDVGGRSSSGGPGVFDARFREPGQHVNQLLTPNDHVLAGLGA